MDCKSVVCKLEMHTTKIDVWKGSHFTFSPELIERNRIMVIVSTRDFRSNQSYYLDMVNRGESAILRSRVGNFRITPVSENDFIKERDLVTDLRNSLIDVKEVLADNKSLQSLDNLIEEL